MVDVIFLSRFNISDCVKFLCEPLKLLVHFLMEAFVVFIVSGSRDIFKLSDDVSVERVTVRDQDGIVEALLHLLLEEDV